VDVLSLNEVSFHHAKAEFTRLNHELTDLFLTNSEKERVTMVRTESLILLQLLILLEVSWVSCVMSGNLFNDMLVNSLFVSER